MVHAQARPAVDLAPLSASKDRGARDQALVDLQAAKVAIAAQGGFAAIPALRRAVPATRNWLADLGSLTPAVDARLTYLARMCQRQLDTEPCHDETIRAALLELELILSPAARDTPLQRSYRARIRGLRASVSTTLGPRASATAAEEAYAEGAAALLDGDRRTLDQAEIISLFENLAGAINSAYDAGDCPKAVVHADKLIGLGSRFRLVGANYPPDALGYGVKASCSLWSWRPREALDLARRAIDLEESASSGRNRFLAGLDLRARYREGGQTLVDPREIGAFAALLLIRDLDGPDAARLTDEIVRWTSETRVSTLSDVILLDHMARKGSPAVRNAVTNLLIANAEADSARRALLAEAPDADARMALAARRLNQAEQAALADGVQLPAPSASLRDIGERLLPGEGFLFIYRSQLGSIIWGLTAQRQVILFPPSLKTEMFRPDPRRATLAPERFMAFSPPAEHYQGRPSIGKRLRAINAWLATGTPGVREADLSPDLTNLAIDLGPDLIRLKDLATYWAIAHNEEIDGAPLAQLPLIDGEEAARLTQALALYPPGGGPTYPPSFAPEKSFGYNFAYAITPSPAAFVALRDEGTQTASPSIGFLGVGDVPFLGRPCQTSQSVASRPGPARRVGQSPSRAEVLGRPCIPESKSQLTSLGLAAKAPRFLMGADATETAIGRYRGQHIGILAFSTHGLGPNNPVSGEWPALLLNPPDHALPNGDDGVLTAFEVADLRLRADLVVLSACSTGVEDSDLGEEPLTGLARGFFLGGARSALITQWTLRADVARRLNDRFARSLAGGESRAVALREARRALVKDQDMRPWLWSVTELIGDGGPL